MANYFDSQILEDGEHNVIAKVILLADTGNYTNQVVLDPSLLYPTFPPSDRLAIAEIQYSVQDGWVVELFWDAPTPKRIVDLTGRGMFPVGPNYGGLQNDASSPTGIITLSTIRWSAPTKVATIIIHATKQSTSAAVASGNSLLQESGFSILQEDGSLILV
jgi:hypothetical protein